MEIDRRHLRKVLRRSHPKERLLDRTVRRQAWLDPIADTLQRGIGGFYGALGKPGMAAKNLMHGEIGLHHPLHPSLTDIPLGAWTVGVLADWLAVATGRVPYVAGDLALAIGVAGAILAALTGYTDFHETNGHERRTALVHGLTMTGVLVLELVSLAMRLVQPDLRVGAILVSTVGWLVAVTGAYVGGHLTFGLGSAVNHNAFEEGPGEFVRVGSRDDFPEGEMRRVEAAGLPVAILRRRGLLYAIGAVCSHAGGPLDEGKVEGEVVTCPWHGSQFRFTDGRVTCGPATFDQPPLAVRERGGIVEVRLAHPLR